MNVLKIADIRFGFVSQMPIECQNEMHLFEQPSDAPCDYIFQVVAGELPPIPSYSPLYANTKLAVYQEPTAERAYYCLPNHPWNFCLEKADGAETLYVIAENADYVQNIWNVFDKIEFSSRLLAHGAVMLHSSYLIYRDRAILFTGPSGMGKSTQAELWRKTLGAEVINGDRSIIREKEGRLWTFGTPYAGTSGICQNRSAPLQAIVTLQQGPENTIRPLTRRECTRFFLAQTTIQRWKAEDVIGTMELWDSFITKVPVLQLTCRPDEDAVYTLQAYLDALDAKENHL